MNRRDALRNLMVASGGLIALPAWADGWRNEELKFYSSSYTADEQATLAAIVDAIIPPGNSIGALSVGVDKFLIKLIDNCYDKEVQDNVKAQLEALNDSSENVYKKQFHLGDQAQRQELLITCSNSEDKAVKDFFNLMKSETIRGFNTSQQVMVNYTKYKVAPGHYYGCVDVKA